MNEGRYKTLSFPRAGALAPAAQAMALVAVVLAPLLVFGAAADVKKPGKKTPAKGVRLDVTMDLRAASAPVRAAAADAVIYRTADAQASSLEAAVRAETGPALRAKLLRAAVRDGGEAAVALLAERLSQDASPIVRSTAAGELGRLAGGPAGLAALAACVKSDADPAVRGACAVSLGFYPGPEAEKALAEAERDADPGVSKRAGLGQAKQKERQGGRP